MNKVDLHLKKLVKKYIKKLRDYGRPLKLLSVSISKEVDNFIKKKAKSCGVSSNSLMGALIEEQLGMITLRSNMVTRKFVLGVVGSFLEHIFKHWKYYKSHLANLRRTLMFYDIFISAIRHLPENSKHSLYINPKDPLIEDLPVVFGDKYTKEIGDLIYSAWPASLLDPITGQYVEPEGDEYSEEKKFAGFTSVRESRAQKRFLDSVRLHPRISFAISLMELRNGKRRKRLEKIFEKIKV